MNVVVEVGAPKREQVEALVTLAGERVVERAQASEPYTLITDGKEPHAATFEAGAALAPSAEACATPVLSAQKGATSAPSAEPAGPQRIIRLGVDVQLPGEEEQFLTLLTRQYGAGNRHPLVVVGAHGRAGTTRVATDSAYLTGPLAIVDCSDDPGFVARVGRVGKEIEYVASREIEFDSPPLPGRIRNRRIAVVGTQSQAPPQLTDAGFARWARGVAAAMPLVIDAGALRPELLRALPALDPLICLVSRDLTRTRSALERLAGHRVHAVLGPWKVRRVGRKHGALTAAVTRSTPMYRRYVVQETTDGNP
ncbi:hypothetical protein QS713_00910 [Gleimia hominis]|uniref:Uncharacterized protein n=1 Tax=Gleimia hominis TaxID=595468 RepID=A0ABU3I8C9_9ACTO|nr:hypothetical protein [Gleimia hominis]MDT3766631.1 hypothetical protein [Gleimia hominis]